MALYELRTYTLHVGKMAEAVKLYQEIGFPALQKGGQDKKLVGYFQSDTGTINQLLHLWKFDDDADRRAHWAGLSANKDFRRRLRVEVPPPADDPGGKATPGSALGAASVRGQHATTAEAPNSKSFERLRSIIRRPIPAQQVQPLSSAISTEHRMHLGVSMHRKHSRRLFMVRRGAFRAQAERSRYVS
jgi:NIPSNAP